MLNWPSSVGLNSSFRDHLDSVGDSVYHDDGTYPREIGLDVLATGAGRVVYDISTKTKSPAVLKVAYCGEGLQENRHEIYDRHLWDEDLRERLVPVSDYGSGDVWVVQLKVQTQLDYEAVGEAESELSYLVEDAGGDIREVYPDNIGIYEGTYVLFDFGGL